MKLKSRLFYTYVFILVAYSLFTLLPAPATAVLKQYDVSSGGLRLIDLTIIAVMAAIWFAGFYGYGKLYEYVQLIRGARDASSVDALSKGLLLLVLWLPITSLVSAMLNYYVLKHPSALPAATIINQHLSLIFPLIAFVFIAQGARGLSTLAKQRPRLVATNILMAIFIYVSVIYIRMVFTTENRALVYQMSIWPIFLTLIAPYMFMWAVGSMAALELYMYSRKAPGVVYRKSWGLLALGFGWLIATSISFQFVTTLSAHLKSLSIYWLLAIVYALLLLLSVGFVLIALGTRKLRKIEEV